MFWMRGTPTPEETVIVSIKDDTADRPNYYTSTGWYYKGIWVVDNQVSTQVTGWMKMPMPLIDQIYPLNDKVTDCKGNKINLVKIGAHDLCRNDIDLINMLYKDFTNLRSLFKLKDEEFNNLTECLNKMRDIIINYIVDLYKEGEKI